MSLTAFLDRWADVPTYDKVIDPARKAVQAALKPAALKDALHGTWLGHPLPPVLVQIPVGSWASAGLLDALDRVPVSLDPGSGRISFSRNSPGTEQSGDSVTDTLCWAMHRPPPEELTDGHQVADGPHHLHHPGQARPAERTEELLRAVRHEDDPDDDPHHQQGDVNGLAVPRYGGFHAQVLHRG